MKTNIFDESWRKSVKAEYEADRLNYEKAEKYALIFLSETLEIENRIEGNRVYCTKMNMFVTPHVTGLADHKAGISFVVYSPDLGGEMYEHSTGIGDDTVQSVEVAVCSFAYSFIDGLVKMNGKADEKDSDSEIATIFGGKTHKWRAYFSDVVTIGNAPDVGGAEYYWNKLKKLILKRLGNQKVCYVKVYLDRAGGDITGECRVDDALSMELSILLVNEVSKWKPKGFASHKMYFFIRQEDETLEPYPYSGENGQIALKKKIKTAMDLFYEADTEEKNGQLFQNMKKALDDDILAFECYSLLPEMCAENAFRNVRHSESMDIFIGDKPPRQIYKNQLADYWPMSRILFDILNSGAFGSHTDELYKKYVDTSAIKSVLEQLGQKGIKPEDVKMEPLEFRAEEWFEVR
jgi:hypothetical protein